MVLPRDASFLLLLLFGVAALLLGGSAGSSSSHSLRYFTTGVSEPGQQVPQFYAVGYVDDQEFVSYDVKTRKYISKAPWMTKVEEYDPHYKEYNNRNFQNAEQVFRGNLVTAARYYNQSGGTHTFQWMYDCELRRDGSKGGHMQYAYDGRDYISLDKETLTWTAPEGPAQNTKMKWEAEPAIAMRWKVYLEETCIEWLQRYQEYGQETLRRTEKPEVTVTRKEDYDGMETLVCRVGGFYPKDIDIDWTRDGKVWLEETYHGLVSPNSDGSYYTFKSIKVDPKERERYKCHVEHDGLLKPVDVAWEEPASKLGLIIGCVLGVLLLIAVLAAIAMYFKNRHDGYKKAAPRDQGSNSSGSGTDLPI